MMLTDDKNITTSLMLLYISEKKPVSEYGLLFCGFLCVIVDEICDLRDEKRKELRHKEYERSACQQ